MNSHTENKHKNRMIFRCDASSVIGGGHVMRCLTLARQMVIQGWHVIFVVSAETPAVCKGTDLNDYDVITLPERGNLSSQLMIDAVPGGCKIMVIDHYEIDAEYENKLRGWAEEIFVIDDIANRSHNCDVLLDQTLGRTPLNYNGLVPAECRLLLGCNYSLLRPEFAIHRAKALSRRHANIKPKRLLISLGMTDPSNTTAIVIDAVEKSGLHIIVEVVLGGAAPHLNDVQEKCNEMTPPAILHVSPSNISMLMMQADIAIGAAGSSAWERCCLGLPTLNIITAENQKEVNKQLLFIGATLDLGDATNLTMEAVKGGLENLFYNQNLRFKMGQVSAQITDGLGCLRTALHLDPIKISCGASLYSSPITIEDSELLFAWQSTPGVRQYSRNRKPPKLAEHRNWLSKRLQLTSGLFEKLSVENRPVGLIRLDPVDLNEHTYEVSILIDPEQQSKGLGKAALKLIRCLTPSGVFIANIHLENIPSLRIFEASGYKEKDGIFVSYPNNIE